MPKPFTPRDPREAAFVAKLQRSPDDADVRAVYADWLEEDGATAAADSLRADIALAAAPDARAIARYAGVLERGRKKTSAAWRDAVLRWSTVEDFVLLPLEEARAALRRPRDRSHTETLAETIEEWVESMDVEEPDDPYGLVRVYAKNVAAAGDFHVSMSAVAVLGDLSIGKQYTDLIESDQSLLAVGGTLRCGAIWELGSLFVAGDVHCDGVIYGSSYNASRGEVLGSVTTEVIIEAGHHFVVHGGLEAQATIGDRISVRGRYVKGVDHAKLDPALLRSDDDEREIDEEKLYERICAGRSVLASRGTEAAPEPERRAKKRVTKAPVKKRAASKPK